MCSTPLIQSLFYSDRDPVQINIEWIENGPKLTLLIPNFIYLFLLSAIIRRPASVDLQFLFKYKVNIDWSLSKTVFVFMWIEWGVSSRLYLSVFQCMGAYVIGAFSSILLTAVGLIRDRCFLSFCLYLMIFYGHSFCLFRFVVCSQLTAMTLMQNASLWPMRIIILSLFLFYFWTKTHQNTHLHGVDYDCGHDGWETTQQINHGNKKEKKLIAILTLDVAGYDIVATAILNKCNEFI